MIGKNLESLEQWKFLYLFNRPVTKFKKTMQNLAEPEKIEVACKPWQWQCQDLSSRNLRSTPDPQFREQYFLSKTLFKSLCHHSSLWATELQADLIFLGCNTCSLWVGSESSQTGVFCTLLQQSINITLYNLLSSIPKNEGKFIFKAILNSHYYFLDE